MSKDPFLDLEDEVDKALHLLQQYHDQHRSLLSQIPESGGSGKFRSDPRSGSGALAASNQQQSSSGHFRPAELLWQSAEHSILRDLDRITSETLDLISDVAEDIALLRTIVEKHVHGEASAEQEETGDVLSGDEVARRVETVHRFERKLNRAKSDGAEMSKFREYRHMQITPDAYGVAMDVGDDDDDDASYLTPQGQKDRVGVSPSPKPSAAVPTQPQQPHTNEFAANFVRQELAEQEKISAAHGELLTQIHVGVLSADQKAKIINQQLKESDKKLSMVDKGMDSIQGKVDSAMSATNKLLQGSSDKQKLAMICCLMTVLVLLLFGLFSGNGAVSR